jgi:hypothetical protein
VRTQAVLHLGGGWIYYRNRFGLWFLASRRSVLAWCLCRRNDRLQRFYSDVDLLN